MTNLARVRESQSTTIEKLTASGDIKKSMLLAAARFTGDDKARILAIETMRKLNMVDDRLQIEFAEIFKQEGLRTRPSIQLLKAIAQSIHGQESLQEIQGMCIHHKALEIVDERIKELSGSIRK
ncbi:MAG: hypothetical protein KGH61_04600 [Candidatus Micrarchaeota archaeon]|nr:hypothetical protein [Candidatus Micrarchaeota archaeon]MDE1848197.1 hypothetical protein [Candidatus Micrarchaeota archaeon]MDE1864845.1 hypothetical protein [Candidatus Micrarchaeota archaeon]